jgi:hypothetical protein
MSKSLRVALFLCLGAWLCVFTSRAQVVISEILADNETGFQDEDKERSDWIEIYNGGADPVNLAGWYLTDEPANLAKWQFPATNLNANGYLLVIASGKNRATAGRQLHTSFNLSSGGEYLALVKPDGKTISFDYAPEFPQQNPNVSYGLVAGTFDQKRFFTAPTPGTTNSAGLSDLSQEPVFSVAGGIYTNNVSVSLSSPEAGAVIRYTLNGSEPTTASAIFSNAFNLASSTAIRAKAWTPGLAPSTTVTRTYNILSAELFSFSSNLPIIVLTTFLAQPNESVPVKASVTLIGTNGGRATLQGRPEFNGRGTIKIRGSSSTQFPKKSYALELEDELLQDKKAALLGMPKQSDWVLYAPYTDKTLIRDFLAYEISNLIGTYAPRTRLVEVFVDANGGKLAQFDYAGVYVLIEKIKRDDNRVDIAKLLPSQTTQPEVSGGYIWKKDRLDPGDIGFSTLRAGTFGWVEPKEQEVVSAQKAYLANFLKSFETALYATNFTNKAYENFYSVKDGIDHHWMVEMTRNIDGFRLSTYVHKDRLGKIAMGPIWDYNLTLGNANYSNGWLTNGWYNAGLGDADYPWYRRLFQDPDFNQRYIDRWAEIRQKYIPTTNVLKRVDQLASVLAESAARNYKQWPILGQYVWPNPDGYQTRTTYQSEIVWMKNWIVGRFAWIDSQFVKYPLFNLAPGTVASGTRVTITNAVNPVYFTLDGSDPRLAGGGISPNAGTYVGPITIFSNSRVVARAQTAAGWSAPAAATYVIEMPKLAITEIMYNPGGEATNDFEFIEVKNVGTHSINLKGFHFSEGIDFTFTNSVELAVGRLGVLVKGLAAFTNRYGSSMNVLGQYGGSLDNSGEHIVLDGPVGERILDFSYNNAWYRVTDGFGYSLVIENEVADFATWDKKESWRASANIGGSPGENDPAVARPMISVNEVLANSEAPALDAIELFNAGASAVEIGNWFLTDDPGTPKKFQVPPGTRIDAGAFLVFTEKDFNDTNSPTAFALNSLGDEVYLFSADAAGNLTGYSDGFSFAASGTGRTFGRYVTSDGSVVYPAQAANTLGAANSGPAVGPVVINEIRYAPGAFEAAFVELKNISAQEVKLYDAARPENLWRVDGIDFTFPENSTLAPNGLALIVPNDPARFRASNNVPVSVAIFGPYSGILQEDGERVQILRPDAPAINKKGYPEAPMVVVDEVRYNDKAPWPTNAIGAGISLQRINASSYGDDPANWQRGASTPGDWQDAFEAWRAQNFSTAELADANLSGASADPDADGLDNRAEFAGGTDPHSAASVLKLMSTADALGFQFEAKPLRSYTVYFRSSLSTGAWVGLKSFPPSDRAQTNRITTPQSGYYKVGTP